MLATVGEGALYSNVKSKYEAARSLAPNADFHAVWGCWAGFLVPAWGSWVSLSGTETRNSSSEQREGAQASEEMVISPIKRFCGTAVCNCRVFVSKQEMWEEVPVEAASLTSWLFAGNTSST